MNFSDKILVKLDNNWADEFDVEALWVTTIGEYNTFIDTLYTLDVDGSDEIYFGTNEFITFDSVEEIANSLEVIPITDQFFNEFLDNIGSTYGLINIPDLVACYYIKE